jgi:hypothetical protein
MLGDGIDDLQATAAGDIWVSYFGEGVFGDTAEDGYPISAQCAKANAVAKALAASA